MTSRLHAVVVVLLLLLVARSVVHAESGKSPPSEADLARASSHFQQGVQLFQEDAFRAALVEFQRAYRIAPDYRLLYNIGQTKLRLQDYLGSVQSYEAYLVAGGRDVSPERRAQVEQALASLRSRVGRIGVTSNRAGAEIFIDDLKAGETPLPATVAVNVGPHRVLARSADGATETKIIEVAGGDVEEVNFVLVAPKTAPAAVASHGKEDAWPPLAKGAVASWAVGGALLVGSAVTGGLTWSAQSELDDMVAEQGVSSTDLDDQRDKLKTLALTTDVLIGTGAAAALIGTVLWVVHKRKDKQDRAAPAVSRNTHSQPTWSLGLGSLHVRGQF